MERGRQGDERTTVDSGNSPSPCLIISVPSAPGAGDGTIEALRGPADDAGIHPVHVSEVPG